MSGAFGSFFNRLIQVEGGYSDDPNDSGGKTRYGITLDVARANGYTGEMKNMPKSFAYSIYKKRYWDALRLDEVAEFSPDLALKLADIGVNMGIGRAAEFLQRLLNALNNREKLYDDIRVDGDFGPITLKTLKRLLEVRGAKGEIVLVRGLNCLQGAFYVSLSERRQKDEAFLYGWLLNRIS